MDQIEIFTDIVNNRYVVPDMLLGSGDAFNTNEVGDPSRPEVSVFGQYQQVSHNGLGLPPQPQR